MMVVADEAGRLKTMYQAVCFFESPVGILFIPVPVEPDASDFPVVCKKLGELAVHIIEIFVPVATVGTACSLSGIASWEIILLEPVEMRMIEEQLYTLSLAFFGEHFNDILTIRCPVNNVPVGEL